MTPEVIPLDFNFILKYYLYGKYTSTLGIFHHFNNGAIYTISPFWWELSALSDVEIFNLENKENIEWAKWRIFFCKKFKENRKMWREEMNIFFN